MYFLFRITLRIYNASTLHIVYRKFIHVRASGGGTLASNWASKTGQSILSRKSLRSKNLFSSSAGGGEGFTIRRGDSACLFVFFFDRFNSFEFHNCSSCTTHAFIVLPFKVSPCLLQAKTDNVNMISFIVTYQAITIYN